MPAASRTIAPSDCEAIVIATRTTATARWTRASRRDGADADADGGQVAGEADDGDERDDDDRASHTLASAHAATHSPN